MSRLTASVLLLACLPLAPAPAQNPAPSILQVMIEHECLLLQFDGGGSPLTPAERQQAAEIVREAMSDPAAGWAEVDRREQQVLATLARRDPRVNAQIWDESRYVYAFGTGQGPLHRWFPTEKRIVEAHDPVLALDAPHRRIVTAHMLPPLREAAAWVAAMYNLPAPRADFETAVRSRLSGIGQVDPAVADGLAHIVRYRPYLEAYFTSIPEAQRATFFKNTRSVFNHLDEPGMEPWQIAETGAMESRFAATHQGGASSSTQSALYSRQMQDMTLTNAARGFSSACNPTLSAGTRASNNCTAPIPVPGVH